MVDAVLTVRTGTRSKDPSRDVRPIVSAESFLMAASFSLVAKGVERVGFVHGDLLGDFSFVPSDQSSSRLLDVE